MSNVDDQGIVHWTALGGKDFGHCLFIQGVGGQAIHRFSGHPHQFPPAKQLRRLDDVLRCRFPYLGFILHQRSPLHGLK